MKQCQLLISGLGLAAPGSAFSAGATLAQQGAELSIEQVAPPTSLDPHLPHSPIAHAVQNTIWNALILNDPKFVQSRRLPSHGS